MVKQPGWMGRFVLAGSAGALSILMLTGAAAAPVERAQVGVSFSATGQAQTLSSTGVADLPIAQPPAPSTVLSMGIFERSAGLDRDAAVRNVAQKVAAVRAALERIGVPSANIEISNATVIPVYTNPLPGGTPPPLSSSAPPIEAYTVSETLQVLGLSPDKVDAAIQTALGAGATNVNRPSRAPVRPPQPDASAISQAVKQAADQARAMAQAGAQSFGITLGSIRNVQVQMPSFGPVGPSIGLWRVSVTIIYNIP